MTGAPRPSDDLLAALHRLHVVAFRIRLPPAEALSLVHDEDGCEDLHRILWEPIVRADAELRDDTFIERARAILHRHREESIGGFPFPVQLPRELTKTILNTPPEAMCEIWRERFGHDRFRLYHSAPAGTGWSLWFANELEASQAALMGLEPL